MKRASRYFERKFKKQGYTAIIGVDEVGIGPLAGPVVAAAVMLKPRRFQNQIDDSKKLTSRQRESAFLEITSNSVYGLGIVNEQVIDRLNILSATCIAMEKAVKDLTMKLRHANRQRIFILIDGIIKPALEFPFTNIIKGDARSKSIAAASIIAKVTRDRIMDVYDQVYPDYGFIRHKGYSTSLHRSAIKEFGQILIHRKSFSCD